MPTPRKRDDPKSIYLWRLLIGPDFQRQGIGRAVMAWLDQWTKDRGLGVIFVTCVPENVNAMRLYETSGYVRTGRVIEGEVELSKRL